MKKIILITLLLIGTAATFVATSASFGDGSTDHVKAGRVAEIF